MASAAEVLQANTFKKWRVGDVTITRIIEVGAVVMDPDWLLAYEPGSIERNDWLKPNYVSADNQLLVNIQAFVIEADGLTILVDPCIGNHKERESEMFNMLDSNFLGDMATAGFPPSSIDIVLCTHLHTDHVGWNTQLVDGTWVPTFPQARYLFSKVEHDYAAVDTGLMSEATYADSVKPIVDAGLAELVDFDHRISKSISLEPSIGHTPGHCSIRISDGGQEAIITGDMIHHPLQASETQICSTFCWDEEQARATRRTYLDRCAKDGTMMLGTHFADPVGVRVFADGNAYKVTEY
jgi:glyoxylase-like metal-dependent hydrolase (beta-lactamase superfamily II)